MLHTVTSSYRELARIAGLTGRPSSSERKKQQLLEMASGGVPKPPINSRLGSALYSYTAKKSGSYDPNFTKNIKEIAPRWFVRSETASQKKLRLIKIAKSNRARPNRNTKLAQALANYTRKTSVAYDPAFAKQIRKLAPHWFVTKSDIASHKKQQILGMARSGGEKPHIKTTLGRFLSSRTTKSSHSYDPVFEGQIRRIRPDWLVTRTDKSKGKKKALLEMAERGDPRPLFNTPLGGALYNYTRKSYRNYDPKFHREIRKKRPDWLINQIEKADQNKQALIKMARKGQSKPHFKTYLGQFLTGRTTKSSHSYDPVFEGQIRRIRPDWLRTQTEKGNIKKKALMDMANKGKTKPNRESPLGRAISRYTVKSSSSYDPKFTKDIRKIRPDWLLSRSEKTDNRKKLLLEMARSGEPRPGQKNSLGYFLCMYMRKSSASYDLKFTNEIRNLRPDWLVTLTEKANEKKKLLLEMARRGKAKPLCKTKLGKALSHYTSKKSAAHDPAFTKQIKKLAPHWFKRCSTR